MSSVLVYGCSATEEGKSVLEERTFSVISQGCGFCVVWLLWNTFSRNFNQIACKCLRLPAGLLGSTNASYCITLIK